MKKLVSLLMAVIMLLSVCSFSLAEDASSDKIIVTFWHHASSGALYDVIKDAVDTFNSTIGEEKGIEVQETYVGSYSDILPKIQLAVTSGDQPTVAVSGLFQVAPQVEDGILADLKTFADADGFDMSNFLDCFQEVYTADDGHVWSFPYTRSTPVLYYNKTMADAKGLTAPTTIEEMEEFCKALYETDENGNTTVYGLEIPADSFTYGTVSPAQLGSSYISEDRTYSPCLEDGTLLKIFSDYRRWVDEGWCKPYDKQVGSSTLEQMVNGHLGAYLASSGGLVSAQTAMEEAGYELGVAKYPYYKDGQPYVSIGGGSITLIAEGNSDEQQQAGWEFIKFLMSDEMIYRNSVGTGYIPFTKSVADYEPMKQYWEEHPFALLAYEQMQDGEAQEKGVITQMTEYMYAGFEVLDLLIQAQSITPEEAIEMMKTTTAEYFN